MNSWAEVPRLHRGSSAQPRDDSPGDPGAGIEPPEPANPAIATTWESYGSRRAASGAVFAFCTEHSRSVSEVNLCEERQHERSPWTGDSRCAGRSASDDPR